jgi:hypothetical protein
VLRGHLVHHDVVRADGKGVSTRRILLLALLPLAAVACGDSSDGGDVVTDFAGAASADDLSADAVPDEWACAARTVFRPVGIIPDDVETAASPTAYADRVASRTDDPVTVHAAEESLDEATFVFANGDGEIVQEIVVAPRESDGLWIEKRLTFCP